MRFDEIELHEAIYDVYRAVDNPRSSRWLMDPKDNEQLCRMIQDHLPIGAPFTRQQMLQAWDAFGKSVNIGDQFKKVELIILAARYSKQCFYAKRGHGDCSVEVALDRIVPGSRGGKYSIENCVIACSLHNSQRGDKSIEDYLKENA